MVDFNGGGGVVGLDPNGWMGNYSGFTGMSAPQINQSMGMGYGGAGDQNQAVLNNIFGNFGQQTDYYSGLGAAYGRQTGGFGGYGAPNADPFTPVGGGGNTYGVDAGTWGRMSAGDRNTFNNAMRGQNAAAAPAGNVERGPDLPPPSPGPGGSSGSPGGNPFDLYSGGGYNPFSPQTYAPAAQGNVGSGNPYGVNASLWGGMSAGDRNIFNNTMRSQGAAQAPEQAPGPGGSSGSPGASPFDIYGSGGGYNPFDPGSFGGAPQSNFGGRNNLAQIMAQGNSPKAPDMPDNRFWSGNYFNANTPPNTVGNSVGMAPGFGGFNNPDYSNLRSMMTPHDLAQFQNMVSPAEYSAFLGK